MVRKILAAVEEVVFKGMAILVMEETSVLLALPAAMLVVNLMATVDLYDDVIDGFHIAFRLQRKLSTKELMCLNCGAGEDS